MKKYPRRNSQMWFFREYTEKDFPEFSEPKNDNERFLNLWKQWRFYGKEEAWGKMWELVLLLCRKAVRLEINRQGLHFSSAEKDDFALDAAGEIMQRLKTYWGYSYRFIVTAVAKAVKHPLYKDAKQEKVINKALALLNTGSASSWDEVTDILVPPKKHTEEDSRQLLLPF